MTWRSLPMNGDCEYYYTQVTKFTLVKETPKAIRIRLEKHPDKICLWMPKKVTRGYTGTSAWFWAQAFEGNLYHAEQRLKTQRENMEASFENFNAIHVAKPTNGEVKKIEKIIDSEEAKNAKLDAKIHNYNPNKQVYNNNRRKT